MDDIAGGMGLAFFKSHSSALQGDLFIYSFIHFLFGVAVALFENSKAVQYYKLFDFTSNLLIQHDH